MRPRLRNSAHSWSGTACDARSRFCFTCSGVRMPRTTLVTAGCWYGYLKAAAGRVVLDDDAFQGGYSAPRAYRGRTARWLYGANSQYGQMTAAFSVDGAPTAGELVISGIDSENGGKTPIALMKRLMSSWEIFFP